jgi:Glycosyl hydrolase family 26
MTGLVVSAPAATAASSSCALSSILVPSCGVLWGSYKPPSTGETLVTAVTDLEAQAGRTFNITYRYHDFSGRLFPDKSEQQLAASGHILLEDWAPSNFTTGAKYMWADVAAGKYDASVIDPEALAMKAYGKPVMLSFEHEMDIQVGTQGTAADYVAAYRHVEDQFNALGATNVIWVWTTTGYSGRDSMFTSLYPGNSYVDWIGWDPYNFASCNGTPWKDFDQTIDPMYQWLEANGYGDKPFILPEYGTVAAPGQAGVTASWLSHLPAALVTHPNIKALLYWDDASGNCNERLTNSIGEMSAFAAAGQNASLSTVAN